MTNAKDLSSAAEDLQYVQHWLRQLRGDEEKPQTQSIYNAHNFVCVIVAMIGIASGLIAFFTYREANIYNVKRLEDLQRQLDRLENKTQEEAREIRGKIDLHDAYIKTSKN
jgi:hypothetical protein